MANNTIPVAEFLKRKGIAIEVPDNQQMTLTQDDSRCADGFYMVEARSFGDLQALSIVPKGIEEKAVRKAIIEDDREALTLAQNHMKVRGVGDSCQCSGGATTIPMRYGFREDLRVTYHAIRRASNPRLATVLSEATRMQVVFDSIEASIVRGFSSRLFDAGLVPLNTFKAADIIIGVKSTLFVTAATKLLFGNKLQIFIGGVLRGLGSFLRIKCASAEGNLDRFERQKLIGVVSKVNLGTKKQLNPNPLKKIYGKQHQFKRRGRQQRF